MICLPLPSKELSFLLAGSEEATEVVGTLVACLNGNEEAPVLREYFCLLDDGSDALIGPLSMSIESSTVPLSLTLPTLPSLILLPPSTPPSPPPNPPFTQISLTALTTS